MPLDPTTCQQYLAAAYDAYNSLLLGRQARVVVDQNGERVEFTATNQAALMTYIRQLEAQCGSGCGGCGGLTRGPIQFTF